MQVTREYIVSQIDELIELGKEALAKEHKSPPAGVIMGDYLDGENYKAFKSKTKMFTDRFLSEHPLYQDITKSLSSWYSISATENIIQHLNTIKQDVFFLEAFDEVPDKQNDVETTINNTEGKSKKVFIVHGHDTSALDTVALFLYQIGCEPLIIKNEASGGLALIDKIEQYAEEAVFAIVLYTACDEGRLKESSEFKNRARQNVVFEHGYLIAKLKRKNVVALVEHGVETPGDVQGVVYVSMSADDWRQQIIKEMLAAGMEVDVTKASVGKIK